ncbi:MAG: CDP-glucose 4,6-dehydratase, partial [Ruminococcus bromii]
KSEKNAVHEANFLKLDCSKLKTVFGWKPHWHVDDAVKKTVEWSCCYMENGNVRDCMDRQIEEFLK